MNRVHLESFARTGQTLERRVVRYDYDIGGLRESLEVSHDAILSTTEFEEILDSLTRFQWDESNPSAHPQSIVQKSYDSDGDLVSMRETVFGLDEIWQRNFKSNSADGDIVLENQGTFIHDGQGSVRGILDGDSRIQQFFTYVAYGELASIHGGHGERIAGIDLRSDVEQSITAKPSQICCMLAKVTILISTNNTCGRGGISLPLADLNALIRSLATFNLRRASTSMDIRMEIRSFMLIRRECSRVWQGCWRQSQFHLVSEAHKAYRRAKPLWQLPECSVSLIFCNVLARSSIASTT